MTFNQQSDNINDEPTKLLPDQMKLFKEMSALMSRYLMLTIEKELKDREENTSTGALYRNSSVATIKMRTTNKWHELKGMLDKEAKAMIALWERTEKNLTEAITKS